MFLITGITLMIASLFIHVFIKAKHHDRVPVYETGKIETDETSETIKAIGTIIGVSLAQLGIVCIAAQLLQPSFLWKRLSVDLPNIKIFGMLMMFGGLILGFGSSILFSVVRRQIKKLHLTEEKLDTIFVALFVSGGIVTVFGLFLSLFSVLLTL